MDDFFDKEAQTHVKVIKIDVEGHVNEQDESYWINKLERSGFRLNPEYTKGIRETSILMFNGQVRRKIKQFIQNRGLYFENTILK